MIAGSPLFKSLGLASGLDGLDGVTAGGQDPQTGSKRANTKEQAVVLPGAPNMPLYMPKDTPIKNLKIQDTRKINPATGQPFKQGGAMTTAVDPKVASFIIKQAALKGVDPNTALAIALQETKMGNLNENLGSAWSAFPDEGIEDPYEQGANTMAKTLVDKLAYAKRLGFDKKGEAYALQAYNGYGRLAPQNTDPNAVESFYGIPVTHQKPLDMRQNPVYGKTILSLRDEIIKKNPELQALIQKELAQRKPQQIPQQMAAPIVAKRN